MNYLDFSSLLTGDPAQIALLSTFQFDPDFFERRLLGCSALSKARRICIFLDARQWFDLLKREIPARWLNRRYLVVPVQRSQGFFHPKLSLLLTESEGQVLCGSNNLTRSGCSSNLELLNALPFTFEGNTPEEINVAREAFAFFQRAAKNSDDVIARIVIEWMEETAATYSWLKEPVDGEAQRKIRLVHTYDGSIWDRLVQHLDGDQPREFFIVSPFHDSDSAICRRLASRWPNSKIEMLVQQGYTNLAVAPLKKLRNVQLSELRDVSRRIHAKLFAWRSDNGGGCLVGSANFTSAALDGQNVETCLLLSDADKVVDALFDRELSRRPIALDEFIPGDADEPNAESELPSLRINSALLDDSNHIRVSYSHRLEPSPSSLRLTIRTLGESHPHASMNLAKNPTSAETVLLPYSDLVGAQGTLLATLVAEVNGENIESFPIWVIQENQLTYEPGEGPASANDKIRKTGEGLPEYLDELGKRDGLAAVVDFLRHLDIPFQGGSDGGRCGPHKFTVKPVNPILINTAPEWLIAARWKTDDLKGAIYEFVERHEKRRLHKHAESGNINGMENFLDILRTLVQMLYIYYKRGVVKRDKLIAQFRTFIELATIGRDALGEDAEKESFKGYLYSVYANLDGDVEVLRKVCGETNYLAEVRAVLLIVQRIRFEQEQENVLLSRPQPIRPQYLLRFYRKAIKRAFSKCGLSEPGPADVRKSLERYQMFSEDEILRLLAELPAS